MTIGASTRGALCSDRATFFQKKPIRHERRGAPFVTWLLLISILVVPSSLTVHLSGDGFKFTAGRAAITVLIIPALLRLLRDSHRIISSDLWIFLTAVWMIGSRVQEDGLHPSAVAETIELLGGYVVARAYFFGPFALHEFMQVLKKVAIVVILLAVLDTVLAGNVVQSTTASIFGTPGPDPQSRFGIIRANSTIEDAELYGVFCCIVGALCLYFERIVINRILWVGFCFFGCALSLSSGPLLAFVLMCAAYAYDRLFRGIHWRWKALRGTVAGALAAVFLLAVHPVSWLISHLTLDPQTGYFRLYVFDYAFEQIALSPIVGIGFGDVGTDDFLSKTTYDSVWLVCALRFGIPMIVFFAMANIGSFSRIGRGVKSAKFDPKNSYINEAGTAFTFAVVTFMLVGLTVHYWNAIWMFWALCLGIRASIKERQLK